MAISLWIVVRGSVQNVPVEVLGEAKTKINYLEIVAQKSFAMQGGHRRDKKRNRNGGHWMEKITVLICL